MTHEELLEKIKREEDYLKTYAEGYGFVVIDALRAIVEFHKPVEDNRCEACYREEYFGGRHLEIGKYPCLTIQAIEKELG